MHGARAIQPLRKGMNRPTRGLLGQELVNARIPRGASQLGEVRRQGGHVDAVVQEVPVGRADEAGNLARMLRRLLLQQLPKGLAR